MSLSQTLDFKRTYDSFTGINSKVLFSRRNNFTKFNAKEKSLSVSEKSTKQLSSTKLNYGLLYKREHARLEYLHPLHSKQLSHKTPELTVPHQPVKLREEYLVIGLVFPIVGRHLFLETVIGQMARQLAEVIRVVFICNNGNNDIDVVIVHVRMRRTSTLQTTQTRKLCTKLSRG